MNIEGLFFYTFFLLNRDVIFHNMDFRIFRPLTHDLRRFELFYFLVGGVWLLHDDWNRANGFDLLPK